MQHVSIQFTKRILSVANLAEVALYWMVWIATRQLSHKQTFGLKAGAWSN